jgi:uncharacterized protein YlxW (UPF0749 family)
MKANLIPDNSLPTALEQERLNLLDLTHSVQGLSVSLNRLQERSKNLDGEISRCRRDVGVVRAEKERQKKKLDGNRERDGPELNKLESLLGLSISGVTGEGGFDVLNLECANG